MKFKIKNLKFKITREAGFGLVEMIVVIAIITATFTAVLQLAVLQRRAQTLARQDTAAYMLAREALEAVRSVRDDNWGNISVLNYGTNYYPEIVSGVWELSGTDPGTINNLYSRRIVISEVFRDANDDIVSSGGTSDPDTILVTAFVEWTAPGGDARTIDLSAYITNWQI